MGPVGPLMVKFYDVFWHPCRVFLAIYPVPGITVIIYHWHPGVDPKYTTFIHPNVLYGRCPWMQLSDLKQSASEYLSESSNGTPMCRT